LVKRTLSYGEYEAEFFVDHDSVPALYHYIITRTNAAEILMWGQEKSMAEAEGCALERMREINKLRKVAAAQD